MWDFPPPSPQKNIWSLKHNARFLSINPCFIYQLTLEVVLSMHCLFKYNDFNVLGERGQRGGGRGDGKGEEEMTFASQ